MCYTLRPVETAKTRTAVGRFMKKIYGKEELKLLISSQFKDEQSGIRALMLKWDRESRAMNHYGYMEFTRYNLRDIEAVVEITVNQEAFPSPVFSVRFIDYDELTEVEKNTYRDINDPSLLVFHETMYVEEISAAKGEIGFQLTAKRLICRDYRFEWVVSKRHSSIWCDNTMGIPIHGPNEAFSTMNTWNELRSNPDNWYVDLNCSLNNTNALLNLLDSYGASKILTNKLEGLINRSELWSFRSPLYQVVKSLIER